MNLDWLAILSSRETAQPRHRALLLGNRAAAPLCYSVLAARLGSTPMQDLVLLQHMERFLRLQCVKTAKPTERSRQTLGYKLHVLVTGVTTLRGGRSTMRVTTRTSLTTLMAVTPFARAA